MFCTRCQLFWDGALRKAQLPEKVQRPQDIAWGPHELVLHTSIDELRKASDLRCRICRLIFFSPTEYERTALLNSHDEIHTILTIDPGQGSLPLLHVEFREGKSNVDRIPKRLLASCSGLLGTESETSLGSGDLANMLDKSVELGDDHTGSDGALQLAAFWIKSCVNSHDKCRSTFSGLLPSFLPTRLLDVSRGEVKLIESKNEIGKGKDRSYLALSHCWGLKPIIRTLKSNYEQHKNSVPAEELSKTFCDAIHATRILGFRYIWIDSMCIIQDDGDDWAVEAATMCDVYQHAVLTIAAAHANDGTVGCFAKRDGLLNLPFYLDISPWTSSPTPIRLHFTTYGRPQTEQLGGGDPALYGRAWVLQEQLLSPRMLIFDGAQIKWECLTLHGSEGSPTSGTTRHTRSYKLIRSGVMDSTEFFQHDDGKELQTINDFWPRMKLDVWYAIVMDYSHRGMTKSKDRLAALAGIAQALSRNTKHEYLAGLWSLNFFIGLLWSLPHNEKFLMSAGTNFDVERNTNIRHEETVAPSWSWASVTAPVMYGENVAHKIDRMCDIEDVEVDGTIDKQSGQVTIHGHSRKGYVNAIYPYTIREAALKLPHATAPRPAGRMGLENVSFKDRVFHPIDYFLFSEQHPDLNNSLDTDVLRRQGPFRFVRGFFRPDEIIDPAQEITFIAIGQLHFSLQVSTPVSSTKNHDPTRVYTLALVPTGDKSGTYRRVGLAMWDDCAWYGYLCGWKHDLTRRITSPREWDRGFHVGEYVWEEAYRRLWWDDMEFYKCNERIGGDGLDGRWKHQHEYKSDQLPDWKMYKAGTGVEQRTVVIV